MAREGSLGNGQTDSRTTTVTVTAHVRRGLIANHHHARRGVVYAPPPPSRKEQGVSRVASHDWPAILLVDQSMDKPPAPVRTGGEAAPATGEQSLVSGEDSTKQ